MNLLKIDSIMFRVKDLDKSAAFYEKVLGLKKAWRDEKEGMIGFTLPGNDSEIVIHSNPHIPNPDFCFLVRDVEESCREYTEKGFRISMGPFGVRCGKCAVLEDPDGNKIPIIDLTRFGGRPRYD